MNVHDIQTGARYVTVDGEMTVDVRGKRHDGYINNYEQIMINFVVVDHPRYEGVTGSVSAEDFAEAFERVFKTVNKKYQQHKNKLEV